MNSKRIFKKLNDVIVRNYNRLTYKRLCRLYCVGAAKTGTHSIDSMFNNKVSSNHEPESRHVINTILKISKGQINDQEIVDYLRKRDKMLSLDVDSSQLNFFLLEYLLEEFPKALFVLTIRDCYSWLDSFINHSLRYRASEHWVKLRNYRFRLRQFSHPPEEIPLKEKGLYTLDGYLSYWAYHNKKVLSSVPENRLMVVKTNELSSKASDIASFVGLNDTFIQFDDTHSFKNYKKCNMLRMIHEPHLEAKVEEHCGALMNQYFPDIGSIDDTRL